MDSNAVMHLTPWRLYDTRNELTGIIRSEKISLKGMCMTQSLDSGDEITKTVNAADQKSIWLMYNLTIYILV